MKRVVIVGLLMYVSITAGALEESEFVAESHPTFGKTHFIIGSPTAHVVPKQTDAGVACPSQVRALFAPDDDLRVDLIKLIDQEYKSLKIAVYFFNDTEIAHALVRALKRGVSIELITDSSCLRDRYNKIGMLTDAGCAVYVYNPAHRQKAEGSIMHDKFVIFSASVWTGSFNFTKSASKINQENAVVISDNEAVAKFIQQFDKLQQRSYRYGKPRTK